MQALKLHKAAHFYTYTSLKKVSHIWCQYCMNSSFQYTGCVHLRILVWLTPDNLTHHSESSTHERVNNQFIWVRQEFTKYWIACERYLEDKDESKTNEWHNLILKLTEHLSFSMLRYSTVWTNILQQSEYKLTFWWKEVLPIYLF